MQGTYLVPLKPFLDQRREGILSERTSRTESEHPHYFSAPIDLDRSVV